MKIGFDAKRAFMNASGLGNYSRTLIRSLLQYFPEHEYFAFTPGFRKIFLDGLAGDKLVIVQPVGPISSILPAWWRFSLVSKEITRRKMDVYHGLSNEIPRGLPKNIKKIVTIHDVIFLRHPEWYPFIDRNSYYYKVRYACKHADAIVAVSEQTKIDIIHYFRTDPAKIRVIYQSCDEKFYERKDDRTVHDFRKKKNLPGKFILYVGTIEERKNLLVVLKTLTKMKDVSLVVIGGRKKYFNRIQDFIAKNSLQARVIFPDVVLNEDLPFYYQAATCFVYPSLYEGFGIPVIEALWSGTPIITSIGSALPEAGGPGSLYMDPHDSDDLAVKLNRVMNDEKARVKMIATGLDYVQRFHPKQISKQLIDLYQSHSNGN